jgi:serine/threonine protein kinase/GTPase SAR1 family protein
MYQCQKGNIESVKQLLENGADIEIRDKSNHNASYYAKIGPKSDECLKLLCERGVKLEVAGTALRQPIVKVMLVGEPGAGKTTLLKRFQSLEDNSGLRGNFPTGMSNIATNGVEITEIHSKGNIKTSDGVNCSLIFYDFGGQKILYPTHQLFLTTNSLYILVVDLSLKEREFVKYWIEQIRQRVVDFVLVCTHVDMVQDRYEEKKKLVTELNSMGVVLRNENVFMVGKDGSWFSSIWTNKHVERILESLREKATSLLKFQQHKISWLSLYLQIKERREKEPLIKWIEWNEYKLWTYQVGIYETKELDDCTRFLVERGVLMTLVHEGSTIAPNLVILDPEWLAEIFSTVVSISYPSSQYRYLGFLKRETLHNRWREMNYDEEMFDRIESLLRMFKLMIPVMNQKGIDYFIPSMAWRPLEMDKLTEENLEMNWPKICPPSMDEFGRRLELSFVPIGYLQQVLARICELKGVKIIPEVIQRHDYILAFDNTNHDDDHEDNKKGDSTESSRIRLFENENCVTILFRCDKKCVDAVFFNLLFSTLEERVKDFVVEPDVKNIKVLYNGEDWGSVDRFENQLVTGRGIDDALTRMAPDLLLSDIPRYNSKDLRIIEKLAEGTSGVVFKAITISGIMVVIKEAKEFEKNRVSAFRREALVMHMLASNDMKSCVNRLLGVYVKIEKESIGLVLEFIQRPDFSQFLEYDDNPSMQTNVNKKRTEDEKLWKSLQRPSFKLRVAQDVAQGMSRLHCKSLPSSLIHNDLRCSNVFLNGHDETSENVVAVVGDVGGAVLASRVFKVSASPELAPEMRFTATWSGYGQAADVYCFGVILWELLSLKFPPCLNKTDLFGGKFFDINSIMWCSPEEQLLIGVMKKCCELNELKRPTFETILKTLRNRNLNEIEGDERKGNENEKENNEKSKEKEKEKA